MQENMEKKIYLSHDEENNLYLNGKKIKTEEIIELRKFELTLLCLTTIGIVVQTIVAVLTYFSLI